MKPAFPIRSVNTDNGMTLRDYFAGQAIAGLTSGGRSGASVAQEAYYVADAMMKERAQKTALPSAIGEK